MLDVLRSLQTTYAAILAGKSPTVDQIKRHMESYTLTQKLCMLALGANCSTGTWGLVRTIEPFGANHWVICSHFSKAKWPPNSFFKLIFKKEGKKNNKWLP
jgi:hypothetical protein